MQATLSHVHFVHPAELRTVEADCCRAVASPTTLSLPHGSKARVGKTTAPVHRVHWCGGLCTGTPGGTLRTCLEYHQCKGGALVHRTSALPGAQRMLLANMPTEDRLITRCLQTTLVAHYKPFTGEASFKGGTIVFVTFWVIAYSKRAQLANGWIKSHHVCTLLPTMSLHRKCTLPTHLCVDEAKIFEQASLTKFQSGRVWSLPEEEHGRFDCEPRRCTPLAKSFYNTYKQAWHSRNTSGSLWVCDVWTQSKIGCRCWIANFWTSQAAVFTRSLLKPTLYGPQKLSFWGIRKMTSEYLGTPPEITGNVVGWATGARKVIVQIWGSNGGTGLGACVQGS